MWNLDSMHKDHYSTSSCGLFAIYLKILDLYKHRYTDFCIHKSAGCGPYNITTMASLSIVVYMWGYSAYD
jgi:hypothetical protein